ncbi:glyoxalase family protein [Aspergillus bertholletiae]|uniref:Glyoxalase family protein n=1 Tax=Aspergillus bertholletiae TaxID=1226010 RepID=A0A5N7B717_9EURO|nr:glyoxalase family protein [Aspergillus bertholletiae]
MTIDHTSLHIPKAKFDDCLNLYIAALKPLGYEVRVRYGETTVGLASIHDTGNCPPADLWVIASDDATTRSNHLAFRAPDRATVDAFHKAAIQAGGEDNGKPGLRTMYHPNYYGAFVIDAVGNNIEAVCHTAE